MDGGAWWANVHSIAKRRTRLKLLSTCKYREKKSVAPRLQTVHQGSRPNHGTLAALGGLCSGISLETCFPVYQLSS